MDPAFDLSPAQLDDVVAAVKSDIGRRTSDAAWTAAGQRRVPDAAVPCGQARALDLGGSRLRAAIVGREAGHTRIVAGPALRDMPWQRGRILSRDRFLAFQSEALEALGGPCDLPLGYCFSYPCQATADGDARLLGWTKGVEVPDVVGHRVGRLLCDALAGRGRVRCRTVRVVNDSVALLWAGLAGPPADFYLGLVAGTGANLAVFWPAADAPGSEVAINLEVGGFHPPHLTDADETVDRESENPGAQRLEKAVSGLYLPRLLKAVCPTAAVSGDSRDLIERVAADSSGARPEAAAAFALLRRSAQILAAVLAAAIGLRRQQGPIASVRVVAEGGLFWSCAEGRFDYRQTLLEALLPLMRRQDLEAVRVSVDRVANATLIGSALAALTGD